MKCSCPNLAAAAIWLLPRRLKSRHSCLLLAVNCTKVHKHRQLNLVSAKFQLVIQYWPVSQYVKPPLTKTDQQQYSWGVMNHILLYDYQCSQLTIYQPKVREWWGCQRMRLRMLDRSRMWRLLMLNKMVNRYMICSHQRPREREIERERWRCWIMFEANTWLLYWPVTRCNTDNYW